MNDRIERLARKGQRMRRDGEHRKAALVYAELTAAVPHDPRWWVLLASAQSTLGRGEDAGKSLRQAAYLLRRRGDAPRFEVVRRLIDRVEAGDGLHGRPRHSGRGDTDRSHRRGYASVE